MASLSIPSPSLIARVGERSVGTWSKLASDIDATALNARPADQGCQKVDTGPSRWGIIL
jgi:hypothetical protein